MDRVLQWLLQTVDGAPDGLDDTISFALDFLKSEAPPHQTSKPFVDYLSMIRVLDHGPAEKYIFRTLFNNTPLARALRAKYDISHSVAPKHVLILAVLLNKKYSGNIQRLCIHIQYIEPYIRISPSLSSLVHVKFDFNTDECRVDRIACYQQVLMFLRELEAARGQRPLRTAVVRDPNAKKADLNACKPLTREISRFIVPMDRPKIIDESNWIKFTIDVGLASLDRVESISHGPAHNWAD
ncbi:hypothetical protein DFQ27_003054, partial [Actinomortierella ambigua]